MTPENIQLDRKGPRPHQEERLDPDISFYQYLRGLWHQLTAASNRDTEREVPTTRRGRPFFSVLFAALLMLAGSAPAPLYAVEADPAEPDLQLPTSRALNSPPLSPAAGLGLTPDTTAVLEAARAWFPASVGGGKRHTVELSRYERAPEIVRVYATYDHPGMPYVIEASFYAPGDPSLEEKRKKVQDLGGKEPHTIHQGIRVYKWPFGGMGSGVGLRLQGKLDVWLEVASPRLTKGMREQAEGEKFPAPPPEAGLEKLDVKGEAFQKLMSQVVAAFGSGDR